MTPSILLVDDEPLVGRMLADLLSRSGYEVRVAASGAEALALAEAGPTDLVLLDVNMPGMDGWETLARLKEEQGPPVVMMSGIDRHDEALHRGAAGFIGKPYRAAELLERVRAVLDRQAPPASRAG